MSRLRRALARIGRALLIPVLYVVFTVSVAIGDLPRPSDRIARQRYRAEQRRQRAETRRRTVEEVRGL